MALQALVVEIQALSGNNGDLESLHQTLKSQQTDGVLRQNTTGILEALLSLHPATHSLGYLYLLEQRSRGGQTDRDFLQLASEFLTTCDAAQIRRAPNRFTALCRQVKNQAKSLGRPKQAILPLTTAITKLCDSPTLLSPIHADLFELCLYTKCYSAALPLLHTDVTCVDPSKTACTATDVLLYCYYGGMLATGLKDYARALELYLTAVTAPTMVLNAITMAALKKFMLVSLIHLGEVAALPKHTTQLVIRAQKSECGPPYNELAKLVAGKDTSAQDLITFALGKQEVFQGDGNGGLVKLVIETTIQRKIQRLTETYITLSLAEVARQVGLEGPQQAELAILKMVAADQVSARINDRHAMVEFNTDAPSFTTEATVQRIDHLIRSTHDLAKELDQVNFEVASDKAFMNRELKLGPGKVKDLDMPMMDDGMMEGSRGEAFQPS